MKNLLRPLVLFLIAVLPFCSTAQNTSTLNPLYSFGTRGDGSIQPGNSIGTNPQSGNDIQISAPGGYGVQTGDTAANNNGYNMRGIAFDPVSGNIILVDTHTGQNGVAAGSGPPPNAAIYVLNPDSGQIIGALNTNGITTGSGVGAFVAGCVAADGFVYIANQVNSTTASTFTIWRWPTANPSATNFNNPPAAVFSATLSPQERMAQTLDVRGSGTNTEIICGTTSASGGTGTNIYYFNTADGNTFAAHRLFYPGIVTAVFNDGIAFGPGNTFWAKQVGMPLYYLSYDPINYTNNNVIATYVPSSPNDPLLNLASLAYDPARGLLAAMEELGGIANGGPGKVWLFDPADPTNHAPAILDSRTYVANFTKATAPMGYLHFGNGRLYANVVNNGMLASVVASTPLSAPTFTLDLPATNRVGAGTAAHFEVFAVADVTNYVWYSNNIVIAGVNSYYINIPNVQTNNSGQQYKVVAYNAAGTVTSTECVLKVVDTLGLNHLNLLWSYSPGQAWVTNAATAQPQRTIAYNPLSNQMLIAYGPSGKTPTVTVVDADSGNALYMLKNTGVSGGQTLTLCGIAVADDGAIYACNVATSDSSFRIYRWANSGPTTIPQVIWGTNNANEAANYPTASPVYDFVNTTFRFGDDLAVRGSGMSTEILLDNQNNPTRYAAVLTPQDSTMTNWAPTALLLQNITGSYGSQNYGTAVGRNLQFGNGNTFWQKRWAGASGAPVSQMTYTPNGGPQLSALQLANTGLPIYTNAEVTLNFNLNLAAGIVAQGGTSGVGSAGTSPDEVDLYDISDPTQAILLSRNPFKINHAANANAIGQVIFGNNPQTGTNYIFALDANNGVTAFVIAGGVTPPPVVLTQPKNVRVLNGGTAGLSVGIDQLATVSWYRDGNNTGITGYSLIISNAQDADSGSYYAIAANINGSVTSQVATVTVVASNSTYTLSQTWAALGGSSDYPYVSTNGGSGSPNERSFAYNALSNQLILVSCPVSSTAYTVYAIDADTGTNYYTLNTSGIIHETASEVSGSNPIDLVAASAASDGAIYISDESPNSSGGASADPAKMYRLYRWATTDPTTAPVLVFQGDPSGQNYSVDERWGDVVNVRGSGTNTEVIVNSDDGLYGAVLRPVDQTMSAFTNFWFNDASGAGTLSRSIQFFTNNTAFEKRKGAPLFLSSYDVTAHGSTILQSIDFGSSTLGPVAVDTNRNLAAGIDFVGSTGTSKKPDAVALYDITDPTTPLLIQRYSFPTNLVANNNFIGEVVIAGNRVYAMDGNNGMMAFDIVAPVSQSVSLTITLSGNNVVVSWPGSGTYTLQGASSLIAPINWADIGTGTLANGLYTVTIPISDQAQFYRLRQ